ncbi:uncharacterized protein LOC100378684 [Saccoglossus kowalevskii]|uniref:Uncharacterized protein LOC100378684 n=1 Tax=Saccoglossus kowalevskii TaxID=10224 RepID=A0ABM0GWQ9_SACKO|nr:PREDICTED: uncharacterized protein LOC100378684 [Saccoglossus kowalevskii]
MDIHGMMAAEQGEVRRRSVPSEYVPLVNEDDSDNDDDEYDAKLPYGGKVYLARKKKPDTLLVKILEACLIVFVVFFAYYAYFYFDNLHFHVTHGYAHLGHAQAMHLVGQKYMHGKGVDKDHSQAMKWFRAATDQGHPHASHNLAVGYLQGYETDVNGRSEAKELLKYAASKGVKESNDALRKLCPKGECL